MAIIFSSKLIFTSYFLMVIIFSYKLTPLRLYYTTKS
nr:MAG TPA: hypothetical protein [Caudoviricetes sp.]